MASAAAARQREAPRLFTDYTYVRRDLVRIAILAGIMLLILIGLTFYFQS